MVNLKTETTKPKEKFILSSAVREMAHNMVLFKNEHVIVINKPSGVPMMPTSNPLEMNIADMLPAWKYTNTSKPIVCHNLDRETSGCVVLARTKNAHRMLGRMFVKRVVPNSVYWGFCVGRPPVNYGRIRMHFEIEKGQHGDVIVARPSPTKDSKVGIAEFVVNASALEFGSFISFYPLTTRRHQERIMAAHALRSPLLGDAKYGGENSFPQSLALFWDPADKSLPLHLHHRKIQLPYKNGAGEFICVTAPLPRHMMRTFEKLGWPVDADDPLIPG
ncbi:23S rRNA pseudouridine955/2504/2580 synthase [Angomonas deanei]|uniref:Pseudouridylate synthase RPUSD4, mitochondrial n=1 Tax=Angomonas deanei TaxID=59799 RepID=A0A7G2CPA3_9TRYP|nr:23S rRNA pseudouridine955/2504/2580 synthase [Angomonas deanei]CAD2221179.1 RNA pseudouridylate synthase, putative [Angomonas deanei]|eukprot:EPY40486.1 23S rRNA pseudouridine955/2504/2580 synthase [Angomonas deanei]